MTPPLIVTRWIGRRLLRVTRYYADGRVFWREQWHPGHKHPLQGFPPASSRL